MSSPRVLYLSYDGALEPLGESQVLPYLRGLASLGVAVSLISFEKLTDYRSREHVSAVGMELAGCGIRWTRLVYHKHPTIMATLFDVLIGVARSWVVSRQHGAEIVHARSYVPALIAVVLKWLLGCRFLFDMRGFWPDERVEGGIWRPGGALYRLAKVGEKFLLKQADAVISLTDAARQEVVRFECLQRRCPPVTVIPTCVDLDRFRPRGFRAWVPSSLQSDERFVVVYSGSLGTWYALAEMMAFFAVTKRHLPHAHFLLLTRNAGEVAVRKAARSCGLDGRDITVRGVAFRHIPEWIAAGDIGIMFSRPSWANKARCPTKLAEFLASGVPVIISPGIGDTETIILKERVGVIVTEFTEPAYERALAGVQELLCDVQLRQRCRSVAERYFSLAEGVRRYQRVYQQLVGAGREGGLSPL